MQCKSSGVAQANIVRLRSSVSSDFLKSISCDHRINIFWEKIESFHNNKIASLVLQMGNYFYSAYFYSNLNVNAIIMSFRNFTQLPTIKRFIFIVVRELYSTLSITALF